MPLPAPAAAMFLTRSRRRWPIRLLEARGEVVRVDDGDVLRFRWDTDACYLDPTGNLDSLATLAAMEISSAWTTSSS